MGCNYTHPVMNLFVDSDNMVRVTKFVSIWVDILRSSGYFYDRACGDNISTTTSIEEAYQDLIQKGVHKNHIEIQAGSNADAARLRDRMQRIEYAMAARAEMFDELLCELCGDCRAEMLEHFPAARELGACTCKQCEGCGEFVREYDLNGLNDEYCESCAQDSEQEKDATDEENGVHGVEDEEKDEEEEEGEQDDDAATDEGDHDEEEEESIHDLPPAKRTRSATARTAGIEYGKKRARC